jgi:hypothetical protein
VGTYVTPIGALTFPYLRKGKWDWTTECQKVFDGMKRLIAKETYLTHPNFKKPFEIHTDANEVQLGACISQEGGPFSYYSQP